MERKLGGLVLIGAIAATAGAGLMSFCSPAVDPSDTKGIPLKQEVVVEGLKMPWAVAFLSPTEWLVTERLAGQIRLVKNGELHPDPIENVPEVWTRGQGGILDITLHPNYKENGWIYFSYASPNKPGEEGEGANTEFVRAKLEGHRLTNIQKLFKATPNKTGNVHFGGRIVFDGKGYIYLSCGERGEKEKAQDLATHQGKIIRLHEDGRVPKDNPFVGNKKALPEIWSYGQRNPQGLVMHPVSGTLWEHEHGPQGGDELNVIEKGKNYGWPAITFGIDYDNSIISKDTARTGMEQPATYWKPSIAPCGMTVVTSDKYPGWKGDLLVGSLKFNYLQHVKLQGNKVVARETILEKIGRVRDIRQGPDGFIYVVVESGKIIRVTPE